MPLLVVKNALWARLPSGRHHRFGRWPVLPATFLAVLAVFQAGTSPLEAAQGGLERFLRKVEPAKIFPGADEFGPPKGEPPTAPIYREGRLVGHAFLNSSFVNAAGYSGKPIHVLVALDLDGKIAGLELVDHREPIVLIGIPEKKIRDVLQAYVGLDVAAFARGQGAGHEVDIVSGATVTVMVIDDSVLRAAIKVARRLRARRPRAGAADRRRAALAGRHLDRRGRRRLGNADRREGSVRRLRLSVADINRAFEDSGDAEAARRPEPGAPEDDFIDLYAAVVSIPSIGRSLLGDAEYAEPATRPGAGQAAILVMGEGAATPSRARATCAAASSTAFRSSRATNPSASATSTTSAWAAWRRRAHPPSRTSTCSSSPRARAWIQPGELAPRPPGR